MTTIKKPTKPCWVCGANDWWWRSDSQWGPGQWLCGRCHPNPNPGSGSNPEEGEPAPEMVVSDQPGESHLVPVSSSKKAYSSEILALRDRVILGNKKLNDAWEQIKAMVRDTEEWSEQVEHWRQANEKLSLLCTELETRGYEDCLYRDDQGKKTVKCLDQGGIGCRVCPSKTPYWEQELMELPGPKVKQTEHGGEQAKFLKKLGGRAAD